MTAPRWILISSLLVAAACAARAQSVPQLEPANSVLERLKDSGTLFTQNDYRMFCDEVATAFGTLNDLFVGDCSEPGRDYVAEWNETCSATRSSIGKAMRAARNHAIGKQFSSQGAEWFNQLDAYWAALESGGSRAFAMKVELDRRMAKKEKSRERNAGIREGYQEDIDELDEYVGWAQELAAARRAGEAHAWLEDYEADAGSEFADDFGGLANYAWNLAEAAKTGMANAGRNAKDDEPALFAGGEAHLTQGWEEVAAKEPFYFTSFGTIRREWIAYLVTLHEEYETVYDKWYEELGWLFNDGMLAASDHMRDWSWRDLGNKTARLLDALD